MSFVEGMTGGAGRTNGVLCMNLNCITIDIRFLLQPKYCVRHIFTITWHCFACLLYCFNRLDMHPLGISPSPDILLRFHVSPSLYPFFNVLLCLNLQCITLNILLWKFDISNSNLSHLSLYISLHYICTSTHHFMVSPHYFFPFPPVCPSTLTVTVHEDRGAGLDESGQHIVSATRQG